MYCGENKVALSSQRKISDALMDLLAKKPYQEITISELCKTARISRQTFYSLFTSRDNVICFTLQERYCYTPQDPSEALQEDHTPLRHLCHGYGSYISHNKDFMQMLVDNHIEHMLYDSIAEALEGCSCFLPELTGSRRAFAADYFAGGITGVVKRYARMGCEICESDLEGILYDLLSGAAFRS